MDEAEVKEEVQARLRSGNNLTDIAERLGLSANAHAVFGDPVERDGITVIPVARAGYGFGGGGGGDQDGDGFGGGGGVGVSPAGFIEVRDGAATYKAIRDPAAIVRTLIPVVFLAVTFWRRR